MTKRKKKSKVVKPKSRDVEVTEKQPAPIFILSPEQMDLGKPMRSVGLGQSVFRRN